jgi:hypothetical protein
MAEKQGDECGSFSAEEVIDKFERLTRDAAAVQRETLRRILADNAGAEYLRGLGLAGRTDPDSFRACVPLATHADMEPYIARIADEGDTSHVLTTATPVTSISLRLARRRSIVMHYRSCENIYMLLLSLSSSPRYIPRHDDAPRSTCMHAAAPARRRGSASTCCSMTTSSSALCRQARLASLSGTGTTVYRT